MTLPTPGRGLDALSPIRVLIAEDEPHLGMILEQFMTARGFAVTMERNGRAALAKLRTERFDVALLDIVMPELDGLEVLRQTRETPMPPEIIIITGNGTIETAIAALKLGAYDFLSKPYRMAEIDALVRRAWEKRVLRRDNALLRSRLQHADRTPHFLTQFAPLMAVLSLVARTAPGGAPVLVSGEGGTGRRTLARTIHAQGGRPDGPFIEIDCSLPSARVEADLFGSPERPIGLLELASGGTLYLAQVEALDVAVQRQLVEALDERRLSRVDGAPPVELDVRVVASTAGELAPRVDDASFHRDLLHRLESVRITLPPLRERVVDVPLLARHFVERHGQHHDGAPRRVLTADAVDALERYRWPGNVRELRNVIERAVLLSPEGPIDVGSLPLEHTREAPGAPTSRDTRDTRDTRSREADVPLTLEALERRHIADILERTHWHQGRAAEQLGISPKTLYRKIREYGFRRPPARSS